MKQGTERERVQMELCLCPALYFTTATRQQMVKPKHSYVPGTAVSRREYVHNMYQVQSHQCVSVAGCDCSNQIEAVFRQKPPIRLPLFPNTRLVIFLSICIGTCICMCICVCSCICICICVLSLHFQLQCSLSRKIPQVCFHVFASARPRSCSNLSSFINQIRHPMIPIGSTNTSVLLTKINFGQNTRKQHDRMSKDERQASRKASRKVNAGNKYRAWRRVCFHLPARSVPCGGSRPPLNRGVSPG